MHKTLLPGLLALSMLCPLSAAAQDTRTLGWGRLFDNDVLGDGKDRWRTGSYVTSYVRGKDWTGSLPSAPGAIIEYRGRFEVIAPRVLDNPRLGQRRYVGLLGFGAHTHFQRNGVEMNVGVDINVVGPQTKLSDAQEEVHDLVGGPRPRVDGFEVDNAIYPTLTFEAARSFALDDRSTIRPFVEVIAGSETLVRTGFDVTMGTFGQGGLRLRDHVTGQRYKGIYGGDLGFSLLAGADLAYVADSRYLTDPVTLKEDVRGRLRLGMSYQSQLGGFFYGLTYLSPEFEGQSEGQLVGSLNVSFRF